MLSYGLTGLRKSLAFLFIAARILSRLSAQSACESAVLLHRQSQIAAALPLYETCLRSDPANVQARSNWGAALAHEGRYTEAIEQDRNALRNAPAAMSDALRLNLALAYYKSGRISEALVEFETLRREQPGNRRVTILLAECRIMLGAPAQAIGLLQPLEAAAPDDLTVAYLLGSALLRNGEVAQGQRLLDRILRNGESAEGHMLLGVTMFQAADYPGAVRELGLAQKLRPDLPTLQSYYGQALLNTGDATAASEAFERELQRNGADFESNLRLGEIHVARKQFDDARPLLERAAQIRPDSAEARDALAAARDRRMQQAPAGDDGPAIGSVAPRFLLARAGSGEPVDLRDLLRNGALVAVFGSYTCPQLRTAAPVLNELSKKFGPRVTFALVYVSEAHGSGAWQSTANEREHIDLPAERTMADKQEHAALCLRKLRIPYQALVDGMDRATEKAYAAWPSRVYVIDRQGRITFQTRLTELEFDGDALASAIAMSLGK